VDAEEFFAFVNTAQERAACDRLFKQLDGKKGDGLLSRKVPSFYYCKWLLGNHFLT
jgi:hypothetical protein